MSLLTELEILGAGFLQRWRAYGASENSPTIYGWAELKGIFFYNKKILEKMGVDSKRHVAKEIIDHSNIRQINFLRMTVGDFVSHLANLVILSFLCWGKRDRKSMLQQIWNGMSLKISMSLNEHTNAIR